MLVASQPQRIRIIIIIIIIIVVVVVVVFFPLNISRISSLSSLALQMHTREEVLAGQSHRVNVCFL